MAYLMTYNLKYTFKLDRYVGINASDVNYSAGRYDPSIQPPFDAGFEVWCIFIILALNQQTEEAYVSVQA